MKSWLSILLAVVTWWVWPLASRAQLSTAEFEAANRLYEEGKYSEAAAAYHKLTQSRQSSAALYFNLGNALFKSGQMGRAVAAYRQAQQLAPRDPDVRANLQFARNAITGPTLSTKPWLRWLPRLTLNEWTVLASAAFWIWLLLLAAMQGWPAARANLRGVTLAFAAAAGLACAGLGVTWHKDHSTRTAIVIERDAVVRHGPLDESQTAFTVHDGAELSVLDQKEDWLRVSSDPTHTGWLRRSQVVLAPAG